MDTDTSSGARRALERVASSKLLGDADRAALEGLVGLSESYDLYVRSSPTHLTGSALIVDPVSGEVLLRWHERHHRWMQVGGHADPSETDLFVIARREAVEESGLVDLVSFPDPQAEEAVQVIVVEVPGRPDEPAHRHGDVRFLLSTKRPGAARAESDSSPLRWCSPEEARQLCDRSLRPTIDAAARALAERPSSA